MTSDNGGGGRRRRSLGLSALRNAFATFDDSIQNGITDTLKQQHNVTISITASNNAETVTPIQELDKCDESYENDTMSGPCGEGRCKDALDVHVGKENSA